MIEIYDDVFDSTTQNHIENFVLDNNASWSFNAQTCTPGYKKHFAIEESPQIVRAFKSDGADVESFNYQPFEKFLKGKYFYRCKSNILFQKKFGWFEEKRKVNMPHVDLYYSHVAMLYYVNESDGDTVIYKEKYNGNGEAKYPSQLTELKRIKPKKGRLVVFDGLYYHASSNPRKNPYRCVINFDLI